MENKNNQPLSEIEKIKDSSNYLRGTLVESFADETSGNLFQQDLALIKFHGSYMQYDRDLESERKKQKLEPLYSYMIRVRIPGGATSPAQYLLINDLTERLGSGTIKLTTRQAFEIHEISKWNLKQVIKEINSFLMDSIAACGDVNRNVMCNPNPYESNVNAEVLNISKQVSKYFTPKTKAYYEIWLNDKMEYTSAIDDEEPIYGKTYLPRKFKMAFAIPPYNDTDVFSNDLGFIAITEDGELQGFNVTVGGGMGMTFGMPETYPRLADVIGFVHKDKVIDVAEQVLKIQRDHGNRSDRKFSRLKYTIDRLGLNWFKHELNSRLGWKLEEPQYYKFTKSGDRYGWMQGPTGKWSITLFVEGGRIQDTENYKLKTALKQSMKLHDGDVRLTPNQNIIIANISEYSKPFIEDILKRNGVLDNLNKTGMRLNSMACVALNLCPLAFAEAERYLPTFMDRLDKILIETGLEKDEILIRMTGCPNGCARPYLAEIGLVGKAPGRYNLYLGASHQGDRLNKLYKEYLNEDEIIAELTPILQSYAKDRKTDEKFGDFVVRKSLIK